MVVLPRWLGTTLGWKAALQPPGSWYEYPLGPIASPTDRTRTDGRRVAVFVTCPICHRTSTILHAIAADGTLSPSLVCGHVKTHKCSWHVFARLEGWDGGKIAAVPGIEF